LLPLLTVSHYVEDKLVQSATDCLMVLTAFFFGGWFIGVMPGWIRIEAPRSTQSESASGYGRRQAGTTLALFSFGTFRTCGDGRFQSAMRHIAEMDWACSRTATYEYTP
jgi:hypothetical protein